MSLGLACAATQPVVLDTNIVLDLWLYRDPATAALREALATVTAALRETPAPAAAALRETPAPATAALREMPAPATAALRETPAPATVCWLATQAMRDELAHVLAYPHIALRLAKAQRTAQDILTRFDAHAQLVPSAPKAVFVCKDTDDQKFIDLAAQYSAQLISKDKAVLALRRRMARLGVPVGKTFPAVLS